MRYAGHVELKALNDNITHKLLVRKARTVLKTIDGVNARKLFNTLTDTVGKTEP